VQTNGASIQSKPSFTISQTNILCVMENDESLNRALADLEMLKAAYPDEVTTDTKNDSFPLSCSFCLEKDSFVQLEFIEGYPVTTGVQITRYRSPQKGRMDAVVCAIRKASAECLEDEVEGAFMSCAAALEAWNDYQDNKTSILQESVVEEEEEEILPQTPSVKWITGDPLMDRKSSFVARACRVTSERQVHEALHQLIDGSSKLQRATHNMVRDVDHSEDVLYVIPRCLNLTFTPLLLYIK